MRCTTLIIGAAPKQLVRHYIRDIVDWSETRLFVNSAVLADFEDVAEVEGWGNGYLTLKNKWFLKRLWRLRPSCVVVLTSPYIANDNIMKLLSVARLLFLQSFHIETPNTPSILSATEELPSGLRGLVLAGAHLIAGAFRAVVSNFYISSKKDQALGGLARQFTSSAAADGDEILLKSSISVPGLSREMTVTERYKDGFKSTAPPGEEADSGKEIAIVGASHALGFYVSNEETFSWKLRELMSDFKVTVYGLSGFTTVDQYNVLKRLLRRENLPAAVVSYLVPRIDTKLVLKPWPLVLPSVGIVPKGMPRLSRTNMGQVCDVLLPENRDPVDLTRDALLRMRELCVDNGVEFLVAAGWGSDTMYSFLNEQGFQWQSMTRLEDGDSMENHLDEWTLWPFDLHPNDKAHTHIARTLESSLRKVLNGQSPDLDRIDAVDTKVVYNETSHADGADVYPLF